MKIKSNNYTLILNQQGPRGPKGDTGPQGLQGEQGPPGTTNYTELTNKPQINSVELNGNKTLNELGIQPSGDYANKSTTLDGYGITDAYTKTEVNNIISNSLGNIETLLSEV